MKAKPSFVVNLIMCSTLIWAVPAADGDEDPFNVPADTTAYCRTNFPPVRAERFFSAPGILDENARNEVVFYDPCDHDPLGQERSMLAPGSRLDLK